MMRKEKSNLHVMKSVCFSSLLHMNQSKVGAHFVWAFWVDNSCNLRTKGISLLNNRLNKRIIMSTISTQEMVNI